MAVERPSIGAHAERVERDSDATSRTLEETVEQRVERLTREKEQLRQELEAEELEAEIEQLRRLRDAGNTPAAPQDSVRETPDRSSTPASSVAHAPSLASRPKLKEPKAFRGNNIKEARNFIRDLDVIFALAGNTYPTDREKVLYGVMFLEGEPHELWHQRYNIRELDDYTFEEFKDFVRDSVGDPVNRSISVTLQYDRLYQKENQTVQAFATEMDVL